VIGSPQPALVVRPATAADTPALGQLRFASRAELASATEPQKAFVARCTEWMAQQLAGYTRAVDQRYAAARPSGRRHRRSGADARDKSW
jgi:hypothetical protein